MGCDSQFDGLYDRVPPLPQTRLEIEIRDLKAKVAKLEDERARDKRGYDMKTGAYYICRADGTLTLSMDDHDLTCTRSKVTVR